MRIHREGRTILFVLLVVLASIGAAAYYFFPAAEVLHQAVVLSSIAFYLLVLQFFRNPVIQVEENPAHILAPADGKVVAIEETTESEYLGERRILVSIFMSPFNVHVNRSPVGGRVSYLKYHPGKYLVAWHPKSSTENERTTVAVRTTTGAEILVRQIAGALARRIRCYVHPGDVIRQGAEFGFIRFGSRVDVFVPLSARVTVQIGEAVKGGRSLLATLA
jgi:phosphatidylserine decarboxylase